MLDRTPRHFDVPEAPCEKAVGLFMDMEGMIAKDFDEGLASLKVLAERVEAPAEAPPTPPTGG